MRALSFYFVLLFYAKKEAKKLGTLAMCPEPRSTFFQTLVPSLPAPPRREARLNPTRAAHRICELTALFG